jgi:DNA-binding GntR family transcriptional regulator
MAKEQHLGLVVVESEPLHEKVYREIVRALVSGQFEPGQKLTSRKLARELGTSDMPVRAALMRLQALRALNALPNGTLEVPQMSASAFSQLMEARLVVEGAAVEKAASHINGNHLRTVRRLGEELTEAAKSGDIGRYLSANYDFKFAIYRHCGNDALLFLIETLWMQVGPFLRRYGDGFKGRLADILDIDYHEQVLDALTEGDGPKARQAIVRDIEEGADFLRRHAGFALGQA